MKTVTFLTTENPIKTIEQRQINGQIMLLHYYFIFSYVCNKWSTMYYLLKPIMNLILLSAS